MTAVFALFLLRASLGLLAVLAFVPEKAGRGFFKLTSATAVFMLTASGALLWRRVDLGLPGIEKPRLLLLGIVGSLVLAVLYNRAWHFSWTRGRDLLLLLSLLPGCLGFLAAGKGEALAFLTDVSSALLLGSAAGAMILGHFYLVVLDLPTSALKRLTALLCAALVLRVVLVGISLKGPGGEGLDEAIALTRGLFSADGVFVWMRVLFGLVGPASLLGFIWKTVELRSTQSATGILYVQLFMVLSGELLATYLRVVAGLLL